ncbi:Pheromone/general odorant binding protein [Trinorchestia longiramus]|nr:Pheromone/general odorant binding protein [Trinorchestia longiramus]
MTSENLSTSPPAPGPPTGALDASVGRSLQRTTHIRQKPRRGGVSGLISSPKKTMKLLLIIPAALLVISSVTASTVEEKLVLKYGKLKMLESCFGKEEMKAYKTLMKEAYKTCMSKPLNLTGMPSPSDSKDPEVIPLAEGEYRYFTEEKVRSLSQKLEAKISNKTCIYQELGYVDESGELLYDNIIKKIEDIKGLDQQLKDDLIDGVTSCKKVATCITTDNSPLPYTPAMIRFKTFYKCHKQKKFIACLKKDLRAKREEFDFTAPEDLNDDVEEDDKMLALIWGKQSYLFRKDMLRWRPIFFVILVAFYPSVDGDSATFKKIAHLPSIAEDFEVMSLSAPSNLFDKAVTCGRKCSVYEPCTTFCCDDHQCLGYQLNITSKKAALFPAAEGNFTACYSKTFNKTYPIMDSVILTGSGSLEEVEKMLDNDCSPNGTYHSEENEWFQVAFPGPHLVSRIYFLHDEIHNHFPNASYIKLHHEVKNPPGAGTSFSLAYRDHEQQVISVYELNPPQIGRGVIRQSGSRRLCGSTVGSRVGTSYELVGTSYELYVT